MSYTLLFQKTYDLVKWIYPTVNKFPRKQRLTLSQRIEVTTIRILELVIDLSDRDTAVNRKKILHELHKLQILLRLCKDLSYLSFKRYAYVSFLITEIIQILDKWGGGLVEVCRNLFPKLCSFRNLELAYRKARRNKRCKPAVQKFEMHLEQNILQLKHELETGAYTPRPLRQFVIRDTKTRVISASRFRDRVVHHALCNTIQPILEKSFIHDSCANQIGKGASRALERFDTFKRRVSENGRLVNKPITTSIVIGYVLKADIRHYFDTVDHEVLLTIIQKKVKDKRVMGLIKKILDNHYIPTPGKGMPLGNLTSQFFANVYLNELDYFVKHILKARHYIRYVDDFVVLHKSRECLEQHKRQIEDFLQTLKLELHPEKSKIYLLCKGTSFLGFRVFYHHKLVKKNNLRRMRKRVSEFRSVYGKNEEFDQEILRSFTGWCAYAMQGDTYKFRKRMMEELTGGEHAL